MGIKGLSRFFNENSQFFKPFKLHDSFVLIDGSNYVFSLYYGNNISVLFGGDYNVYAEYLRKFFRMFAECNIKPIVVFDGGLDKSGKKIDVVFRRLCERLTSVKNIVHSKKHNKQVIPILAHDVFINVLKELNILFVICDYEADDQIVALANYYKCPIISADSDFYISDVHYGYIKSDSIGKNAAFGINPDGKKYKYLSCSIYYINDFISHFSGIQKDILPLFSILMGNDYVERDEFDNFCINIQVSRDKKVIGLLNWLKNKSLDNAMSQILQDLNENRQKYIKSIVESPTANSDFHHCNLQYIINQKLNYFKCEILFHSGLTTPCGNSLPLDFIINYHSGNYSYLISNIIVLHKSFLVPQIDNLNSCSSYMCARYIRRVIYGILTRHNVNGVTCRNHKCIAPIVEYDRHEERFEHELVEPIFNIEGIGALPKIGELSSLKRKKAKLILMGVLGINLDFVKNLPPEWQLFISTVNYFLCNSVPCCNEEFLYALILNLIYRDIIRYSPCQNTSVNCKSSQKNHVMCSSISCIVSKINETEIQHAEKNLNTYLSKPSINHVNPLCVNILHNYSQLQSCLLSTALLNKLLGGCLTNPNIHTYLNGSFLYNLTKDIASWSSPKLFVLGILGRRTNLLTLFNILESKVRHDVPDHYVLRIR